MDAENHKPIRDVNQKKLRDSKEIPESCANRG